MRTLFIFIALSLSLSFATIASAGLLDDIQNGYIDDVYTLPAAQEKPVMNWQESDHTKAWISILGYREMAHINGKDYVNGDPGDLAIVRGDAIGTPPGISDGIEKSIEAKYIWIDKTVTVRLHTILKWHQICNDSKGSFVCSREKEEKDFIITVPAPKVFTPALESINITGLAYNHSQLRQRILYIETSDLITYYKVTTPNGSIAHRIQIGQPDMNIYGIPFANFSAFNTWNISGTGIINQGDAIYLSNLNETYSIEAFTPFGNIYNLKPTITYKEDNWKPSDSIASITFFIIFVLSVLFGGVYYMRRKWH
jgi:hypothetical protein